MPKTTTFRHELEIIKAEHRIKCRCIEQAVRQMIERAKPSTDDAMTTEPLGGYSRGISQYHSNLLAEINGSQDESS